MKLYTEEQLLNTIKSIRHYDDVYDEKVARERIEKHLKALQPIELPSDEEIEKDVMTNFYPLSGVVGIDHRNYLRKEGFQEGIKYLRNKIQGGNK